MVPRLLWQDPAPNNGMDLCCRGWRSGSRGDLSPAARNEPGGVSQFRSLLSWSRLFSRNNHRCASMVGLGGATGSIEGGATYQDHGTRYSTYVRICQVLGRGNGQRGKVVVYSLRAGGPSDLGRTSPTVEPRLCSDAPQTNRRTGLKEA